VALKKGYEKEKEKELTRKFSNTSYLTPESIRYLNGVVSAGGKRVNEELIYAGMHSEKTGKKAFKRTEKKKQFYKGRQKRSTHKPQNRRATKWSF